ncbi:hypothetical protein H0H87_005021 [Tephrocybe sp. NHM501043]|nr:hypothetical protein H0H87_005021 [Tephrocybe sp. NHM501043]
MREYTQNKGSYLYQFILTHSQLNNLAKRSVSCPISSLACSNVFNSQPITLALVNSDSLLQSTLVLNPITPSGLNPITPSGLNPITPSGLNPITPSGLNPITPSGLNPITPSGLNPITPSGLNPITPSGLNPITPSGWSPPDNSLYDDDSDNE